MNKQMIIIVLAVVVAVGGYYANEMQPSTQSAPGQAQSEDKLEIDASKGKALVAAGALLVDTRTSQEFAGGHLEGAVNIPYTDVESRIAEFGTDKNRTVVTYCKAGYRAGKAAEKLRELGWSNAFNAGGIGDWQ